MPEPTPYVGNFRIVIPPHMTPKTGQIDVMATSVANARNQVMEILKKHHRGCYLEYLSF